MQYSSTHTDDNSSSRSQSPFSKKDEKSSDSEIELENSTISSRSTTPEIEQSRNDDNHQSAVSKQRVKNASSEQTFNLQYPTPQTAVATSLYDSQTNTNGNFLTASSLYQRNYLEALRFYTSYNN
jgi:hypothetical protein